MPVYLLGEAHEFPPPGEAEEGLLAVGGDLEPGRLLAAYRAGIFPWYSEDEPILWHSPDPRAVLTPQSLRVARRLERTLRRSGVELTMDTAFVEVIEACATSPRPDEPGTWITTEMRRAYTTLHEQGYAHSVEVRRGGALVGGLYGVSLGAAFFGESMFSRERDASKIALVETVRQLERWGIRLVDCQVPNPHLERLGAERWPRERFLATLDEALEAATRRGPWTFDPDAGSVRTAGD